MEEAEKEPQSGDIGKWCKDIVGSTVSMVGKVARRLTKIQNAHSASQAEYIRKLESQIEKTNACNQHPVLHASSAWNTPIQAAKPKRQKPHRLMVKATDGRSIDKLERNVKKCLEPRRLKIAFNGIEKRPKGFLVISLENKEGKQVVEAELKRQIGDGIVVSDTKKGKARIIVHEIDKSTAHEDALDSIKVQNQWLSTTTDDELVFVSEFRPINSTTRDIVLETSRTQALKIVERGYLNVEFKRCRVRPSVRNQNCYRCEESGHERARCKGNPVCPRCGGQHEVSECSHKGQTCYR